MSRIDADFARHYEFAFDDFQARSFDLIDDGIDVVVAAPTGSGKTIVAEYGIDYALRSGGRAFYTTPMKALSNQKFHDLGQRFGPDRVGLLTGDHSVRPDADIVVMTTEVLRNMMYARSTLSGLVMVIVDEVHFLQDEYRGPVWEEVIIQLPPSVQLVCLSATVSNSAELAEWMSTIRRPAESIVETKRPVPLATRYLVGERRGEVRGFDVFKGAKPNPAVERFVRQHSGTARGGRGDHRRQRRRVRSALVTPDRIEVLEYLRSERLLPCVHFIFSRRGCSDAAQSALHTGIRLSSTEEGALAVEVAERRVVGLSDDDLRAVGYDEFVAQLRGGVAAHHAGMIPAFREIVEECFIRGLVKLVYATETLAVGVNMPARSVVIEKLSKYNGVGHEMLSPAQYTQLAGRAGRRGIDTAGTVVVLWSPYVGFDQVAQLTASTSFDLRSAFRPTYNMTANLIARYNRAEAVHFLGLSFAQFQADRHVVALERSIGRLGEDRAELMERATSPYGDIIDYRDGIGGARGGKLGDQTGLAGALGALKPGDIVAVDHGTFKGPAAVVATASRSAGIVTTLIAASGRQIKLKPSEWTTAPVRIGRVVLPGAYSPNRRGYRDDVAKRIKDATLGSPPHSAPTGTSTRHDSTRQQVQPDVGQGAPTSAPIEEHPVMADPDLAERLTILGRVDRLDQKIARLQRRLRGRDGALAAEFDRVVSVLEVFDLVDVSAWELTPGGEMLARVFHENDLLICRSILAGAFDGLRAPALAGLLSGFVHEHRSSDDPPPPCFPDRDVERRWRLVEQLSVEQDKVERGAGHIGHRQPDPTIFEVVHGWVSGGHLDDVLTEAMTGGDFVRIMRQLADLLEQIAIVSPSEATRRTADQAVGKVYRDLVADVASQAPEVAQ